MVRYYGELYNGTGITQTVSNTWQAWGACGWILNQATNESVGPTTNQWYIAAPLPTGNCGGVYTYTLGVTYNSITSTQAVSFTVTGPTPTPPPTGIEQVAIDYNYDPLYRLTRAQYSGSLAASYAYSYDAVGNRLTQDANGVRTTYGYDSANRLTSVNGQAYTWDNNGNLTSDGLLTYSYDQANRLKQVTQGANTYTFAYNGAGDRLSQTVGITTTHYVLDPAAGLTQVLADGTNTYLYGNGRLAQYQTDMQYFGADGLGSVRQLYDASGQVLANMRYDPYGNLMSQYGEATSVFGFTGEQWDAATGLEYLRARYYSNAQGRFFQPDPFNGRVESPMSLHKYLYATNNPVRRTDPSGRDSPLCDNVFDCEAISAISEDFPTFLGSAGYQLVNDQLWGFPDRLIGSQWKPTESYSFWLGQQGGRRVSSVFNTALAAMGAADMASGVSLIPPTVAIGVPASVGTFGLGAIPTGGALVIEGGMVVKGAIEAGLCGSVLLYQGSNPLPGGGDRLRQIWEDRRLFKNWLKANQSKSRIGNPLSDDEARAIIENARKLGLENEFDFNVAGLLGQETRGEWAGIPHFKIGNIHIPIRLGFRP
jgi:RHS repeat-associated protein